MGQPAARVGDMHVCPMFDGPKPHVGGPVLPLGVPTVLIGGMPAATVGTLCACLSVPDMIIRGSFSVKIGGRNAARLGDRTAHGGVVTTGCLNVHIGLVGLSLNSALSALSELANSLRADVQTSFESLTEVLDRIIAKVTAIVEATIVVASRIIVIINNAAHRSINTLTASVVAGGFLGVTWIRAKLKLDPQYDGEGFWGTRYVGPTSDFIEMKKRGIKPVDLVDAAAQQHDQGYLDVGAEGISGAFFNIDAASADRKLANDARQILEDYHLGKVDPHTGQPISKRTYTEAYLVYTAFDSIATCKETASTVNSVAQYATSEAREMISDAANYINKIF